jgi:xylan 1,4-beta-xylosidase
VATAAVDVAKTSPEARAGLAVYGWRGAAAGVSAGGGKVFVWRSEDRKRQTLATADAPAGPILQLRVSAAGGETYRFAYSADGREWKELGGAVAGAHIEGAHVALTVGGPAGARGAFDWIRVTPRK